MNGLDYEGVFLLGDLKPIPVEPGEVTVS